MGASSSPQTLGAAQGTHALHTPWEQRPCFKAREEVPSLQNRHEPRGPG